MPLKKFHNIFGNLQVIVYKLQFKKKIIFKIFYVF